MCFWKAPRSSLALIIGLTIDSTLSVETESTLDTYSIPSSILILAFVESLPPRLNVDEESDKADGQEEEEEESLLSSQGPSEDVSLRMVDPMDTISDSATIAWDERDVSTVTCSCSDASSSC
jgi:hypothetical protein